MKDPKIKGYVLAWEAEILIPGYDVNYMCHDENDNPDPDALTDEEIAAAIKWPYERESMPDGNNGYGMVRRWTVYK